MFTFVSGTKDLMMLSKPSITKNLTFTQGLLAELILLVSSKLLTLICDM